MAFEQVFIVFQQAISRVWRKTPDKDYFTSYQVSVGPTKLRGGGWVRSVEALRCSYSHGIPRHLLQNFGLS